MLTFMWRSWCYVDHGVWWGGMLTFMWRSWCYVDHGVGWDVNVHVTLTMLRWSWGGVGWDATVHVTLISGTQTIDSDWKSLKCWLPKEASKKRGTVDLVTHSSKLEQRVWQWMWRRTELRGNNSEKLAAMSKLFNGWSSFQDVQKQACNTA